jgi:hypothetical protein
MIERTGNWMQTYTGRQFWPLDPRPDDIDIIDIAAALSKLCRFGGHCRKFYSVAEHCVHIAGQAPHPLRFQALMHDAAEAYLVDVPRPIKHCLTEYLEIERRIEICIFQKFKIPYPIANEVKHLDNRMLLTECNKNMGLPPAPWGFPQGAGEVEPLDIDLQFWPPERAEHQFLAAFALHSREIL